MVIVALDFENKEKALSFLKPFKEPMYVKVGMELFYSEGKEMIQEIKKMGHKIFLDLKMHDIPNTVSSCMKVLANLDVDMINLHAAGGIKMMHEALLALEEVKGKNRPLLIAVTQLTSTSQDVMNQELMIQGNLEEVVKHYALNAKKAGLDGVVCSPLEVQSIKKVCGKEFITVTPGIRPLSSNTDDQVRITTPTKAREIGCDYIVVGRPITKAPDPVKAYNDICYEFLGK